ncbi:hypothetical protein DMI65_00175 [Escherichia coli]|nr:hypothetical protein [Escherichia coli]
MCCNPAEGTTIIENAARETGNRRYRELPDYWVRKLAVARRIVIEGVERLGGELSIACCRIIYRNRYSRWRQRSRGKIICQPRSQILWTPCWQKP